MADYNQNEDEVAQGEATQAEGMYLQQRRAVNNAYAALQGRQTSQTFAAFTFEEALDAHLEEIEGDAPEEHPNKLGQIARIEGALVEAVEQLKEIPPEEFMEMGTDLSVNTEED